MFACLRVFKAECLSIVCVYHLLSIHSLPCVLDYCVVFCCGKGMCHGVYTVKGCWDLLSDFQYYSLEISIFAVVP